MQASRRRVPTQGVSAKPGAAATEYSDWAGERDWRQPDPHDRAAAPHCRARHRHFDLLVDVALVALAVGIAGLDRRAARDPRGQIDALG
jgi:hypothetical protein